MIRITKQTDYGIVLLTYLAGHTERLFNAPELAAETHLPLPMVSKILKVLTREGMLASHRGVKGGYSLARLPEEISMAEIIAALEGPIALTECVEVFYSHPIACESIGYVGMADAQGWKRIGLNEREQWEPPAE